MKTAKSIPNSPGQKDAKVRVKSFARTLGALILHHRYIVGLALLFVVHVIINRFWLMEDSASLSDDVAVHLQSTLRYYFAIDKSPLDINVYELVTIRTNIEYGIDPMVHYPPFVYILTSVLFLLFGTSPDVAASVNLIFLAILLGSIYGIGKTLYDKKVGLLAAFSVSTFPMVFGLSRLYFLDFALLGMVTLSIYLLIRTDYLEIKSTPCF